MKRSMFAVDRIRRFYEEQEEANGLLWQQWDSIPTSTFADAEWIGTLDVDVMDIMQEAMMHVMDRLQEGRVDHKLFDDVVRQLEQAQRLVKIGYFLRAHEQEE